MARKDETRKEDTRADEGRLARWSRLKREAVAEKQATTAPGPDRTEALTAARTPAAPAKAPETEKAEAAKKIDDATKDLPPIENLGKESDYAPFMREGVPEETRNAALRKLWRSDPAFTEPFPFEMHMEDYNKTFVPINAATDTLFRAGVGYLFDDDKAKAKTETAGDREEEKRRSGPVSEKSGEAASESAAESLPSPREDKNEIGNIGPIGNATGEKSAGEKISMSGKKKRDQSP